MDQLVMDTFMHFLGVVHLAEMTKYDGSKLRESLLSSVFS